MWGHRQSHGLEGLTTALGATPLAPRSGRVEKGHSPEGLEGGDGAGPVHGEEEQAGGGLADVVHVEVLGHRAGHGQLQQRTER